MNKENFARLVGLLWVPVGLILLGLVLLFNPDSASALISKLLGWVLIAFGIGFGVSAISSPQGRPGKVIAAIALAMAGGWLTSNPLALAAWVGRFIGVLLVVDGIQDMLTLRRQGQRFLLPLVVTIIGAILILLPMTTTRLVFSLCGGVVLVIGILTLIDRLRGNKRLGGGRDDIIDAL